MVVAFIVAQRTREMHGISPADAGTYAGVALLLTIVALAASALAARAAASLEPMRVLRDE